MLEQGALVFFLKGTVIGFSIAAPVGPIGVLCIRRTLAEGRASGFVSGLGAATADALYGAVAGFGLTAVSSVLVGQEALLRVAGGGFLIYLGLRTALSRPAEESAPLGGGSLLRAYGSTFFLTLTNPMTIISFAAIFSGLGAAGAGKGSLSAGLLVLGVFTGSALWWLLLSGGAGFLKSSLTVRRLRWVNWLSGATLVGFGLFAFFSLWAARR